jgi:methylated-DNA-[protein]-cysteine S-methyltransferase
MDMHHQSFGPSITMLVYALKDEITQITLSSHQQPGFRWQIVAKSSCPKLEFQVSQWVESYCAGNVAMPKLPLKWEKINPFTLSVLNAIDTIPFGKSITYGELAEKIGRPKAVRATGTACGKNPFPLIIPCHRVLAKDSRIGGYSLDLSIKMKLLSHERIY